MMEKIYYNGCIITMKENDKEAELANTPEAVLVKNGIIKEIGKLEEVKAKASKSAELVDLDGHCLMPAFIDGHSHIVMNGQMSGFADLSGCESYEEIIDTLKKYKEKEKKKTQQIIFGYGYDHNFLKEMDHPDKRVLDQVSTDIPIMILHVSAHLACVNSVALNLAGVTEATEDPFGGRIGRIPGSKEPSGYLEEAAMGMVQKILAPRIKVDILGIMNQMQKKYIENGITTAQDGATTLRDFKFLTLMGALKKLKIDVVAYPLMTANGQEILHKYSKYNRTYKGHLKIGGYKLVLDGSPQGRSAWMSQPYLGGEEGYCGYPWLDDKTVEENIEISLKEGQQILAHCNGDAASQQFIDIYEKVSKRINPKDIRPVMIHCQTVRNDQLDRMAGLKMIASVFIGHVWYWGDIHLKNFGESRGMHISPVMDALKRDVLVNFHQDTPVTNPNMMHSIWCAVNRKSRLGVEVGPDQKVDVYDALKAITINAAYSYFEENTKGSIEIGKRADLVVLDKSPLVVESDAIREIKVLETIKDGKSIYKRERL